MKTKLSWIAVLGAGMLAFTGCKKDSSITNQQDLVGSWYVTGITSDRAADFNGDGYTETDIYGSYNSCQRDIVLRFDQGGTGVSRQGCNAPSQTFYWTLNGNSQLNIDLPGDDLNLNITQFSSNTLRGVDQVYLNGSTYNITYTLQRY